MMPVMPAPGAYDQSRAMVQLSSRTRYQPQGLMKPIFLGYLVSVAVAAFVVGFGIGWLEWSFPDTFQTGRMGFFTDLFLPIIAATGVAAFGAWVIRDGEARRWWLVLPAVVIWSVSLLIGLYLLFFMNWSAKMDSNPAEAIGGIVGFVFLLIVALVLVGQICINDPFRVYYPVDGGMWGEELRVHFRSGSGLQVLTALEAGDVATLQSLRADGPNQMGHAWQSYTTMTMSVCPGRPDQPVFLHLKDIYLSGGLIFSKRTHSSFGFAKLRHVMLLEEDLRRLAQLVPMLFQGAELAPVVNMGEAQPLGAQKGTTPLGLPVGAPPVVQSSNGSFIAHLDPAEHRKLRPLTGWLTLAALLSIFGGVIVLGAGATLLEKAAGDQFQMVAGGILVGLGILIFLFMFSWLLFQGKLIKPLAMRMVRSRPSLRFQPTGSNCMLLNVEDARTYHIRKLLPDDTGLIHVSPAGLDLELSRTRIHLAMEDINFELHVTSGGTALRLSATVGGYPWAVTVSSAEASGLEMNPRKKAEKLWGELYRRLQGG